jgi:hypothetical protein
MCWRYSLGLELGTVSCLWIRMTIRIPRVGTFFQSRLPTGSFSWRIMFHGCDCWLVSNTYVGFEVCAVCCLLHDGCLNGLIIEPEDGGSMLTFIRLYIVDKWISGFRRISWGLVVVSLAVLWTTNGWAGEGQQKFLLDVFHLQEVDVVCAKRKLFVNLPTIIK